MLYYVESEAFEGFEDHDALEFEQQQGLVEGKSPLMHTHLSYVNALNSSYLFFIACINFGRNPLRIMPSLL
jgi:hypothetical protein